jgi:hypothetical protein
VPYWCVAGRCQQPKNSAQPLQDARNCDMELFAEFWARCVLDCGYPLSPGAFILGFGLGVAGLTAQRRARARGRILRSCWAGEGPWAYQEGQLGRNLPLCAQLGAARFRQDESKEVHEVGSKRPSLGCNGVHVIWWIGLIFRLLLRGI